MTRNVGLAVQATMERWSENVGCSSGEHPSTRRLGSFAHHGSITRNSVVIKLANFVGDEGTFWRAPMVPEGLSSL